MSLKKQETHYQCPDERKAKEEKRRRTLEILQRIASQRKQLE